MTRELDKMLTEDYLQTKIPTSDLTLPCLEVWWIAAGETFTSCYCQPALLGLFSALSRAYQRPVCSVHVR